jgi:hypothetical protein
MTTAPKYSAIWNPFAMTELSLENLNKNQLARMAKDRGIVGWHEMRKDQLVRALSVAPPAAGQPAANPPTTTSQGLDHSCKTDRIIVLTRDTYWLHAYWELSRTSLARAMAKLGQNWNAARPILRVMDVSSEDPISASERHVRDIPIHGGVNNWYIDVLEPPRTYRIDIGYLTERGRFYALARSNVVTTPKPGVTDPLDENWIDIQKQLEQLDNRVSLGKESKHHLAIDLRDLFEERLRRPMSGVHLQNLAPSTMPSLGKDFHFQIDAELIVYGVTEPNAKVTLQGEPVLLNSDGSFTVRFSLPDSRQIIPAVASSANGLEERTIVLAVERNTKELEPMILSNEDESSEAVRFSLSTSEENEFSRATHISRSQPTVPERSTPMPVEEEPQRGDEAYTITNFTINDTTYPLRRPCLAAYKTSLPAQVEYVVESFEPLFVGRGASASLAKADWIEQVHSAFQLLYRKMPFEMTTSEANQWSLLEQTIDVDAYIRQSPIVLRHMGKVSRVRHAPCEVVWIDGSKEEVSLVAAPAEFAGFALGQWFEALVERDPGNWHVRRILNVVPTEPVDRMPRERLKRFWESLPTTSSLPKSTRDWTEK